MSYIVTFILSWWIFLFISLPIGVKEEPDQKIGHDSGAPKNHNIKIKMIISTFLAAIFTYIFSIFIG